MSLPTVQKVKKPDAYNKTAIMQHLLHTHFLPEGGISDIMGVRINRE
jgi:hypothetical protein